MVKNILISVRTTLVLALITGILFPLAITAIAQMIYPSQANGSLIVRSGKVLGSQLIGQPFARPEYFHSRPSAAGSGYAGEASGGTNLAPTSKKLLDGVADDPATKNVDESFAGIKQLSDAYRHENGLAPSQLAPVDAVTRSASGLDPDISVPNALLQAPRVARARHLREKDVVDLVESKIQARQLGCLGEPRVNVLILNLALDKLNNLGAVR